MKVNISGVGLIPKVGLLAPVYGKDLTKDTVAVILGYASFKVYVASTGVQITKKNINEIFGPKAAKYYDKMKGANVYWGYTSSGESPLTDFFTTDSFEIEEPDFYLNGRSCVW